MAALIRFEVSRRQTQALLVATLLSVGASEITSETLRMTTTYPAPSGVYQKLSVKTTVFRPFDTNDLNQNIPTTCYYGGLAGPCLPAGARKPTPGQVFYNSTKDAFYYTSVNAVEGDDTTYFRSMSGTSDALTLIDGNTTLPWSDHDSWVRNWSAVTGVIASDLTYIRSPKAYAAAGLYVASFSGKYCTTVVPLPLEATPSIILRYKRFKCATPCTSPYDWSGWTDIVKQADPMTIDPATGCADFSGESIITIPSARGIALGVRYKKDGSGAGTELQQSVSDITINASRVLSF